MKTQIIKINGKEYLVKKFSTKQSAENFINKKNDRFLIYFTSHKYYVAV